MFQSQFKEIKHLGKGSFGEVRLVQKISNGQLYAIKKINKHNINLSNKINNMLNEIAILSKINHPRIAKFYSWAQDGDYYYIVMEYINGGDLDKCLRDYKSKYGVVFQEEIVQYLMRQILDAVYYLHKNKIVHRDLKLKNIMVQFDNFEDKENLNMLKAKVKIIDFGISNNLDKNSLLKTVVGSLFNVDPIILENFKILKSKEPRKEELHLYNEKCDIWSLGTVCYELAIGKKVFEAQTIDELYEKIQKGKYKLPKTLSKEIISFINSMLVKDADYRKSAEELLKHRFIVKSVKDFHFISTKVTPKTKKKDLKKSIWALFEEEDKIINIQENNFIQQNPIVHQKVNNPLNQINHCKTKDEEYLNQIQRTKEFYGINGVSFYGQVMSPIVPNQDINNNQILHNQNNNIQRKISSPINHPLNLKDFL